MSWSPPIERGRRAVILLFIGIGVALAFATLVGGQGTIPICTAEGRLGPDGAVYGRDPTQQCQFVNDQGELTRQ